MTLSSCALPPAEHTSESPASPPVVAQPEAPLPSPPPPAVVTPIAPAEPPTVLESESAAAPRDKGLALRTWVDQQSRIYHVAAPLLISNTELCPQHARPILGFTAKNRYSFSSEFIEAAHSSLGLDEELRVMDVLPGSGAEQVGMRKGDVLVAIEIEPAPQGPGAEHVAATLIGEEMQGRDSVHLTVGREGQRIAFDVPLTQACAMVLDLGNTDEVRSFSDGQRVMVTRGMLGFVHSDEELAYALAREIARNEVTPVPRPTMKDVIDRLHTIDAAEVSGGAPPAAQLSDPASDEAADKLALYFLARAGYDIDGFQPFRQRLDAVPNNPNAENHPVANTSVPTLNQTIKELKTKMADGLPLIP